MVEKRKKVMKYIWLTIGLLAVILVGVNFFRTHWLENYLAHKLIERTSEETDGFYNLSYKKLSISFLNGELKIEGIRLTPDSTVYAEWKKKDSLPDTYLDLSVEMIHFKGLNLTWRHDFKKLHFKAFQIKQPDIKIYQTGENNHPKKEHKHAASKNVYQMISKYIEELSVGELNLDNASILYTALNPKSPIVYSIQDVSFDAYGFFLDQQTYENGKLLFCDNFKFTTHQPQQLLSNNDFILNTDSICLSTADSIIYISNISLNSTRKNPGYPENSLDAAIKTVSVNGIEFNRKEALSYLTIRAFNIINPEIETSHMAHQPDDLIPAVSHNKPDDDENILEEPLTLYDIISPILHQLIVKEIDIDDARLKYTLYSKKGTDRFKAGSFTFKAYDIVIDSVSTSNDQYLFSQDFAFSIKDISGEMGSSNHRVDVKELSFNSMKGNLLIEDARFNPISTTGNKDYIVASVDKIELEDVNYVNGINVGTFIIDRPQLKYTVAAKKAEKKKANKSDSAKRQGRVNKMFTPYLTHLSLKNFRINNAGFIINDQRRGQPVNYELEDFFFYATDLLLKEAKNEPTGYLFSYGKIGFSFHDFDNYLPGGSYRLSISQGSYATNSGLLSLSNIALLPQDTLFARSKSNIWLTAPQFTISGLNAEGKKKNESLSFSNLTLNKPDITIKEVNGDQYIINLNDFTIDSLLFNKKLFSIGSIQLNYPLININSIAHEKKKENKKKGLPSLILPDSVYQHLGKISEQFSIGSFAINRALVDYTLLKKDTTIHLDIDTTSFALKGIDLNTIEHSFGWEGIYLSTCNFKYPIDHGLYDVSFDRLELLNDSLYIGGVGYTSPYSKMKFSYVDPKHKSWNHITAKDITMSGINIPQILDNHILRLKAIDINDITLQNFVNQKTKIPHHKWYPMIYEYLQKAPFKIDIPVINVNDFTVIYQELSKKGTEPGTLSLNDLTGTITNFTNVLNPQKPYMIADMDGRLMDKGEFNIVWEIPVDSLNDHFVLKVNMSEFDLTEMNKLITNIVPIEIKSGHLTGMTMHSEASSVKAKTDMLLQFENLHGEIVHEKEGEIKESKLATLIADKLLTHENKDKHAIVEIERNPYHPTFNYIWQIMEPVLIESVGFSEETQEDAVRMVKFIDKIKHFFHPKKKIKPFNYPDLILPEKE